MAVDFQCCVYSWFLLFKSFLGLRRKIEVRALVFSAFEKYVRSIVLFTTQHNDVEGNPLKGCCSFFYLLFVRIKTQVSE